MTRKLSLALAAATLFGAACYAQDKAPAYKTTQLSDQFYCEGAFYGDFNKDGKLDIISGPYWYQGPDFKTKHQIYTPKAYSPESYSLNFLTFVGDYNNDGWTDVLAVGWPAKESYWYENPGSQGGTWKQHLVFKSVGGESPVYEDVDGDKKPELVCVFEQQLGYLKPDAAKPNEPWTWHPITPKQKNFVQYTHGTGVGDINGDGRPDILESTAWWEQPANAKPGEPWIKHAFKFADAGAQMLATDVDGDGKTDVITALHCHLFGLAWYKQVRDAKGEIGWEQHVLIPQKPADDAKPRFSQAHALDLTYSGNQLTGFAVGKRWWAHGSKGDVEPMAPAVLYWFELKRDKEKGATFIAHELDNNSGVGTQVAAVDLNADGKPDFVVGNKKGTFVTLSQGK